MKDIKLKIGNKYELFWQDISHNNAWIDFADLQKEIAKAEEPIRHIGYFIEESKMSYVFSSGINDSGRQYFDLVVFPKRVIKKIKLIK